MRFASATSTLVDATDALGDVIEQVSATLPGDEVSFVLLFASGHDAGLFDEAASRLHTSFPSASTLGCTAEGTIGDGRELERQASVSLLAGVLPDVTAIPVRITQDMLEADGTPWADVLPAPEEEPVLLCVADPFSIDVRRVIADAALARPGLALVGGLASGARQPGMNRMLLDGAVHAEGLCGVVFQGALRIDTVVSQGCRPIGSSFVVTQGEANLVKGLRGRPAMTVLQDMAQELPEADQALLRHGIFLGRAIDEYKSDFERGDFLIHNIVHADPESGAIAVAGEVRAGTTVQFHVRDAASADEDIRQMLARARDDRHAGAALFSCNGRGTRMWDAPGHDVSVLREIGGELPVAGFFCAGEIGPVGGQNFIHGYTASIALFRPA